MNFDEQRQARRPSPGEPQTDDPGPRGPGVDRPSPSDELLRRMRKVDPDQAKRYRQRSGE